MIVINTDKINVHIYHNIDNFKLSFVSHCISKQVIISSAQSWTWNEMNDNHNW